MSNWSPHLFTAFKDLKKGDHAAAVGAEIPYIKTLDHAVQLVRGRKAPTPRYFLFQQNGQVHFGEWGRLKERLGDDHPYVVDGPDATGRPIKYFQSFSASKETPIPSYAWLEQHADWFKEELDKLVRSFNELNDDNRSKELNKIAGLPKFEEAYKYGDNFWDKMAQKINRGERVNGVVLPGIEKLYPNITEHVNGIITESSVKKNSERSPENLITPDQGINKRAASPHQTRASSQSSSQPSNHLGSSCWGRMKQSANLLIGAGIVASIGFIGVLWALRARQSKVDKDKTDNITVPPEYGHVSTLMKERQEVGRKPHIVK